MLFDEIATKYDLTNRVLSGGIDLYWRRKVAGYLPSNEKLRLLDCATGTADQLLTLLRSGKVHQAVGIDIAREMLQIGARKLRGEEHRATLKEGSATEIPYGDASFEAVTISFGIRNIDNVPRCLTEMFRVLTPGGRALILEFSIPQKRLVRKFYHLYLNRILPKIGKWITSHEEAYRYLATTIQTFPHGKQFCALMESAGFSNVQAHPLTWGVVTIYSGEKR